MARKLQTLDLDFVRAQYPASRWTTPFFENAGGAFVPNSVVERMASYMTEAQVQTGYPFKESQDAASRISHSQNRMAELIGADTDEVILGPSTSMNIYVLAQALRPLWQAGDQIIVSTLNHESNSGPWRRMAEFGIEIIEWPVDPDSGALNIAALTNLLNHKTRLVTFPQVSNITGDINDVEQVTRMAHQVGALVCVDGVAFAPHRAIDVKHWDVDFYVFSFYKIFGPHLGLLYCKRDRLLEAKGQYHYFFPEDDLGHKLNPAGPNHETIASLTGIIDYLDALYEHHFEPANGTFFTQMQALFQLIAEHEETLARRFLDFVNNEPDLKLVGTTSSSKDLRVPTFSLQMANTTCSTLASNLARSNIACGSGHFYAKRLLDCLHLAEPEVLRCSMAHYTSYSDVDQLISALKQELQ